MEGTKKCRACDTIFSSKRDDCATCGAIKPEFTEEFPDGVLENIDMSPLMTRLIKSCRAGSTVPATLLLAKGVGELCKAVNPKFKGVGALAPIAEWFPILCCPCSKTCCYEGAVTEFLANLQPHPAPFLAYKEDSLPMPSEIFLDRNVTEETDGFDYERFRHPTGYGNCLTKKWAGAGGRPYGQVTFSTKSKTEFPDARKMMKELTWRTEFKKAPTNTSALLSWLAGCAIHDFFRTDIGRGGDHDGHDNEHINVQSSYLDLTPIYGFDMKTQLEGRTLDGTGKLRADTYIDVRLPTMPAVLSIFTLFRRHHNWICDQLKERYPKVPETDPSHAGKDWTGDLLFQQARIINCGCYLNTLLRDYAGGILGYWPQHDGIGVPDMRAGFSKDPKGFHCTLEFLSLYNFHATLPTYYKPPDELMKMMMDAKAEAKKNKKQKPEAHYEATDSIHKAQVDRTHHYSFDEKDDSNPEHRDVPDRVVDHLVEAMTHPSGAFGGLNSPQWPKGTWPDHEDWEFEMWEVDASMVERMRRAHVGTFNDFCQVMGKNPMKEYTDITGTDAYGKKVAGILEKYYGKGNVNDVELLVGCVASKPDLVYGWGPPSVLHNQAILSDAFSSIRHDRFYTTCMTKEYYTEWEAGLEISNQTHILTLIRQHTQASDWQRLGVDRNKFEKYMPTGKVVDPEKYKFE